MLAPAIEGFSPTPEMPEIAEAQTLLVAIEAGASEAPINTAMRYRDQWEIFTRVLLGLTLSGRWSRAIEWRRST